MKRGERTALPSSPPGPKGKPSKGLWNNGYPLPPNARKCSYIYPAKHSHRGIPLSTGAYPTDPSFLCPNSAQALTSVQLATQLAQLAGASVPIGDHLKSDSQGAPLFKAEGGTLLYKALSRSHQEAFSRDSKLVQKVGEDYYQEKYLHFDSKTSCDMADIIWSVIKSAGLLSSEIHEIKETWTGWSELQYANYALRARQKD